MPGNGLCINIYLECNNIISMLTFEDSFEVKTTPEKAYSQVIDMETLVNLVPDLISHEKINDEEMKLTAKAGVSFIKGKFDLILDITDKAENKHITLKGRGNGSGICGFHN